MFNIIPPNFSSLKFCCCLWIGQVSCPEHYLLFLRLWGALDVVTPLSVLFFTLFGVINITFPIVTCVGASAPTEGLSFVVITTLLPGANLLAFDDAHALLEASLSPWPAPPE